MSKKNHETLPAYTSSDKQPASLSSKRRNTKKLFIIIVSVLLLACIAVGIGLYIFNAHKPKPVPTVETPSQTRVKEAQIAADSKIYSSNGDVNVGIAIYDNAIKNAQTNDEKANLYLQKSLLASKNNQINSAIEAAELGISLSDGTNDALYFAAASAYEQNKDYEKALENYTKAREAYLKTNNGMNTGTAVYYQKKIDTLKGSM